MNTLFWHNADTMDNLDFSTLKQGHCCKYNTPLFYLSSLLCVCRLSLPPYSQSHWPPSTHSSSSILSLVLHHSSYLHPTLTMIFLFFIRSVQPSFRDPSSSALDLTIGDFTPPPPAVFLSIIPNLIFICLFHLCWLDY